MLQDVQQRKIFSIIDGIIGQEGQGPTSGTPIHTSLLLGGQDPVAVDTIACQLMGFDAGSIKVIMKASKMTHPLSTSNDADITIKSNMDNGICKYKFKPPKGWEILSSL